MLETENHTIGYIITGIAGIVGALGLKELYPYIFKKGQTDCEKKLIRLSSNVAVIFTIIKDEFKDNKGVQQAMDDTIKLIEELKKGK